MSLPGHQRPKAAVLRQAQGCPQVVLESGHNPKAEYEVPRTKEFQ